MKTRDPFHYGILYLLACLLSGCTLEEDDYISKYCPGSCTEIKGRIRTGVSRQGMQGVPLTAIWNHYESPFGGNIIRKKAVAKTDQHGNYTLRFLFRDGELENGYMEIHYGVDQDTYLDCWSGRTIHPGFLKRDTTYTLDFYFPKVAHLTLELANAKDMASSDRLFTTIMYPPGSSPENTCGKEILWDWRTPTRQKVSVAAEEKIVVVHSKFKNSVQIVDSETLTLSPGEQRTLKITF